MPKIDWYINDKHQISGRYFFSDFNRPAVADAENVLRSTGGNAVRVQNISFIHTYTVSPSLLLNSTFGWNSQTGGSLSGAPFSFRDAGVNIAGPQDSLLKAPPALNLSITGAFGIGTTHKGDFNRGSWTIREVVTKISGAHEFRFGGEAIRLSNEINNTFQMMGNFGFSGQITGDGLADYMLGEASQLYPGRRRVQRSARHQVERLRSGQLARQSEPDAESRRSVGSVSPVLRPAGPSCVLPAGPAVEALPERAEWVDLWRRKP